MNGKIAEVFDSIQGEGLYLGERQLFVRFFGCNLKCQFCDTKLDSFTEYAPEELFGELKLYRNRYHSISFTGGEPLLQKDFFKELLKLTAKENFRSYLETNGTLSDALADVIDYLDIVAMDIKLPSSTGLESFWDKHRKFLEIASKKEVFLKAVICKSTKEEDLENTLKIIKEINNAAVLVLQPNSYENGSEMSKKVEYLKGICIKNNVSTCIIPQIQKIIGFR